MLFSIANSDDSLSLFYWVSFIETQIQKPPKGEIIPSGGIISTSSGNSTPYCTPKG
jgi:hypothetical protein